MSKHGASSSETVKNMGGGGGGGRRLYIHDMGSDESHFNVSLVVRDSHKTVSTDHNF